MGAFSRSKGARGERWFVGWVLALIPECGAKRGFQFRFGGSEFADVVSKLPYHFEVKVGKKPNPRAALEQAVSDSQKGMMPVAVVKDDRKPAFVVMTLEDWGEMAKELWELSEGA